jgi:hypothetical protein
MGSLTQRAKNFLEERQAFLPMKEALSGQSPPVDEEVSEVHDPSPVSNTQMAFDLNSGHNPTAPLIRKNTYAVGTIVTVKSPLFGRFKAEVLLDNGVVLWVLHPFIQREVAIPSEWLIGGEGQTA